jgi:16S rRNA (cytidine1402-2'-O)-methyltransferase
MPGISDPGYRAVQACVEAGLRVEALPGANAALTAIAASGLPTDTWYFGGFPPQKKGRATFIANLVQRTETCVLYESPHRMERLLTELVEHAGPDREVVVARELTKLHEEYLRGTVGDVLLDVQRRGGLKGECVVVIRGATKP